MQIPHLTLEQIVGIITLVGTLFFYIGYLGWNIYVKGRRLNRVAIGDRKAYMRNPKRYRGEIMEVFSATSQVVSQIVSVNGAIIILAITLMMSFPMWSFEWYVTGAMLALISIASISYFFCIEQLTTIMSPSVSDAERFRLYEEAINLKLIGFALMWGSVLVAMLLVNVAVTILVAIFTCVLIYRHYERRWIK